MCTLTGSVLFNRCVLVNMIFFVAFFVNYLKCCTKYFWKLELLLGFV